jgi:hypothetical protein
MKKFLYTISIILGSFYFANSQTTQSQFVVSNGGGIEKSSVYTSFAVVGELAVSNFSNGTVSGTIGYLTEEDSSTTTSIFESYRNNEIWAYPNPTSGEIFINFRTSNVEVKSVKIINSVGEVLIQRDFDEGIEGVIKLNQDNSLSSGMYYIQVSGNYFFRTEKIIVIY